MNESLPAELIDEVADRFEAAWKDGRNPPISEYLEGRSPSGRLELLAELVRIDAAYRWHRGQEPSLADYLDSFPELHDHSELVRELSTYISALAGSDGTSSSAISTQSVTPGEPADASARPRTVGRFRLLDELGSGSFGTVYRAYDERLQRHVAVKTLRGAAAAGQEERVRFLREAQSVAQLRHEAIVAIYETGDEQGVPFVVSELIAGPTLQQAMAQQRFTYAQSATLIAAVARALDYAHNRRIIHRDVKPSNILLDADGRPHISDFGLAKRFTADGAVTVLGQVLGTPAYMSPEQAEGRIDQHDARSDIYSLGVVLYELLTGERPFRGELRMLLDQARSDEPRPPRRLDDRIPRDLETICLKAMAKEPSRRYQTAAAFADDLDRFLAAEPILARPISMWELGVRRLRRNWKVAVPSAIAFVAVITLMVLAALTQIADANLRAAHAQSQAQQHRREVLVERVQRIRLRERTQGWSTLSANLIGEAAAIRRDPDLRDYAAATLEGLDARVIKQFENFSASSVCFDADGKRLLLGGFVDSENRDNDQPARLYVLEKPDGTPHDRLNELGLKASGPVVFTPNGRQLQLAATGSDKLTLYDLQKNQNVQTFEIADIALRDDITNKLHPLPLSMLTPDGSRVAAAVRLAEDRGKIIVWDASTGKELNRWDLIATAVAFAPDGTLLAAGDDLGRITIWSIPDGKRLTELQAGRNPITSLAFQHNPRRTLVDGKQPSWRDPWLLAAGDYGGTITVWNPTAGVPVVYCRGASHQVTAVAFNSDGTLLVGGAHSHAQVWDLSTGQSLLQVQLTPTLQDIVGLTFSPNGKFLAISSLKKFSPATVVVLRIEYGRGIQTLRGLSGQVERVRFSSDDRLIAALSHRWEIGLWRASDGRLLRIFDAPIGLTADNASVAISPDGRRLAFSTSREARLWDIESARQMVAWKLPPGLQDQLAFAPDGKLYLLRFETRDGKLPPISVAPVGEHPRVCRVRHLNVDGTLELRREFDKFATWRIATLHFAPDASYFLGTADRKDVDGAVHSRTFAVDVVTGQELWQKEFGAYGLSRTGPLGGLHSVDGRFPLYELPANRLLCISPPEATTIGAGRHLALGGPRKIGDDSLGLSVFRIGHDEPIVTLGIDRPISSWGECSLDETKISWGHRDGRVAVADLPTIQSRLAEFGLGW